MVPEYISSSLAHGPLPFLCKFKEQEIFSSGLAMAGLLLCEGLQYIIPLTVQLHNLDQALWKV